MKNLTPEVLAEKVKSAEEMRAFAKENGIELTEEEAKICYEELTTAAVSDEELEAVAGGIGSIDLLQDLENLYKNRKAIWNYFVKPFIEKYTDVAKNGF